MAGGMDLKTKYKIGLFFIGTGLTFFIAFFLINLFNELKLNENGWSRSENLGVAASHKRVFATGETGERKVYGANENELKIGTLKESDFSMKHGTVKGLELSPYNPFWVSSDGGTIYYLKNKELIRKDGANEETIARDVDQLFTSQKLLILSGGEGVFLVRPDSGEIEPLMDAAEAKKVKMAAFDPESSSFLIAAGEGGNNYTFTYFLPDGDGYKPAAMSVSAYSTAVLSNVEVAKEGEMVHIIYSTIIKEGGGRDTANYYAVFPIKKPPVHLEGIELDIYEKHGLPIDKMEDFQFYQNNGELQLLFHAEGPLKKGRMNVNMYEAHLEKGLWKAGRISTHYAQAMQPLWYDGESAGWMAFEGEKYEIWAASRNKQVIEANEHIRKSDVMRALEDTFTFATSSFVFLLFCLILLIPAIVMVCISFFFRIRNGKWLFYVSALMVLVLLFFLLKKTMTVQYMFMAPDFMKTDASRLWLPAAISILAAGGYRITRNEDWEDEGKVFYFVGVISWIAALIAGPYII